MLLNTMFAVAVRHVALEPSLAFKQSLEAYESNVQCLSLAMSMISSAAFFLCAGQPAAATENIVNAQRHFIRVGSWGWRRI